MKIPKKQLEDMGFVESRKNLFRKEMDNGAYLFRDYRHSEPSTYAYKDNRSIDYRQFQEAIAIEKIEEEMKVIGERTGTLTGYVEV